MISLYRVVRSQAETLISFQGDQTSADHLSNIVGFKIPRSKKPDLCEGGFYLYIRGAKRVERERAAIAYLSANYQPPPLELTLFEGNVALPDDRPVEEWGATIEWKVREFFSELEYSCDECGLKHGIFRKEPRCLGDDLKVHEGVSYRIRMRPNYVPVLQVDLAFRYELNGRRVSRAKAYQQLQEKDGLTSALDQFESRDTEQVFGIIQSFVDRLSHIPIEEGFQFIPQPLSAEDLKLDTWIWSHESPVKYEIGGGQHINLAKELLASGQGFFRQPPPFEIITVRPSKTSARGIQELRWRAINDQITKIVEGIFGRQDYSSISLSYDVTGSKEAILAKIEQDLEHLPERVPLFLLPTPPKGSERNIDPELVAWSRLTQNLSSALRKVRLGTYVVSLDCENLKNDYARKYVLENAIIKGLTALGGIPWRVRDIAMPTTEINPKRMCFIGIDVNVNRRVPAVGGVVLDGFGTLLAYHLVILKSPCGDYVDRQALRTLTKHLIKHYREKIGCNPEHIVIHRDGRFINDEAQILAAFLKEGSWGFDLVEIRKSGAPRLKQLGNRRGTPSRDIAVGCDEVPIAFVSNTLSVGINQHNGLYLFPATKLLTVYRVSGLTSMRIIAAQVYALSLANIGALRRTERLPATISYADALVNNAHLRDDRAPHIGKVLGSDAQPYWI